MLFATQRFRLDIHFDARPLSIAPSSDLGGGILCEFQLLGVAGMDFVVQKIEGIAKVLQLKKPLKWLCSRNAAALPFVDCG